MSKEAGGKLEDMVKLLFAAAMRERGIDRMVDAGDSVYTVLLTVAVCQIVCVKVKVAV